MSLSAAVAALATRVGQEIKAVRAEIASALSGKANDSAVVHTTGNETIAGLKTFTTGIGVPTPSQSNSPVRNDDARNSNARTPIAHASSHASGGSDPVTPGAIGAATAGHTHAPPDLSGYQPLDDDLTTIAGLTPANGALLRRVAGAWAASTLTAADVGAAPASHSHAAGDVTSGTFAVARLPVGTAAGTVAAGNDSRLSDARTPTAHKSTHATGGSDALTPADIGARPDGPVASLRQNTVQNLTATTAAIRWYVADVDTAGGWSSSTNPTRYTCKKAGLYWVACKCGFLSTANYTTIELRKNGSRLPTGTVYYGASSLDASYQGPVIVVRLAVNDYVEMWASPGKVADTHVAGNLDAQPSMHLFWLAP